MLIQPLERRRLFAITYSILDLGEAPSSGAYSVRSIVDGFYAGSRSVSGREQAYRSSLNGSVTALEALNGANSSAAWMVNASGVVVGASYISGNRAGAAATSWNGNKTTNLGTGEALAISDSGIIVGISNSQPVRFANGSAITLGTLPDGNGSSGKSNGVNDAGTIVGVVGGRAFSWSNGNMTDLTFAAGGNSGEAFAVNKNGAIVGQINNRGFFTLNGGAGVQALPTRAGSSNNASSAAYDINDNGQAVGVTSGSNGATYWDGTGGYALADLVPNLNGWTLDSAVSISNDGRIIGYGTLDGDRHAFALVPGSSRLNSKGTLIVEGSGADDTIAVGYKNAKVRVNINGTLINYTPRRIKRININAGAGDDSVSLGSGVIGAYIDGAAGNDTIGGGDGSDYLVGGDGNDKLTAYGSRDSLFGNAGNDTLLGGTSIDYLDGGSGTDRSDNDSRETRISIEVLV